MKNSIKLSLAIIMIAFTVTLTASVPTDFVAKNKTSVVLVPVADVKIIKTNGETIIVNTAKELPNGCAYVNNKDTICDIGCLYRKYTKPTSMKDREVNIIYLGYETSAQPDILISAKENTCMLVSETEKLEPVSKSFKIENTILTDPSTSYSISEARKRKAKSRRFSKNNFYCHYT